MPRGDQATSAEVAYITRPRIGAKIPQLDGSMLHVGRTPEAPDHEIHIITKGNRVMSTKVFHKPLSRMIAEDKKKEGEVKARQDLSKKRRQEQLAKKRARTPKPKNK